jgi:hypothetical protein
LLEEKLEEKEKENGKLKDEIADMEKKHSIFEKQILMLETMVQKMEEIGMAKMEKENSENMEKVMVKKCEELLNDGNGNHKGIGCETMVKNICQAINMKILIEYQ